MPQLPQQAYHRPRPE